MNKTAIKNFAVWARQKLISDITYKAGMLGITEDGIADKLPHSTSDLEFYDIGTKDYAEVSRKEIKQRNALVNAIRKKEKDNGDYKSAFGYVVEEVAYTWFNRLIAIRFMEVNDYLPSGVRVLSSENKAKKEPDLVTTPFDTDLEFTSYEQDRIIQLKDDNKLDELFRMLFIKQCNKLHDVLPELFEKTDDYTELLLTVSFTDSDGVLFHLVHDIEEDDFNVEKEGQVQIIGWLYQFYNTELKDDTFAQLKKKVKITKERIPAATQLFTPDWIVRYMVENSLGRLWLEGHPNAKLHDSWKYYLDEARQEQSVEVQLQALRAEYKTIKPEEIKVIDPCMGSGHILVYAFDVLMQIYLECGYTEREAVSLILQNNLFGLDIDDRAYQLAYFAVMMKARQYDRRFLTRGIQPNLYSIRESNGIQTMTVEYFHKNDPKLKADMESIITEMRDAKEYGSILNITPVDFAGLYARFDEISNDFSIQRESVQNQLLPLVKCAEVLAQKYDVVVTNPPYMGSDSMGNKLKEYVGKNYYDTRYDIYAAFIVRCLGMKASTGFVALITQNSFLYALCFDKLRAELLEQTNIVNAVHLGPHAFEDISGEVVQTIATIFMSKITDFKSKIIRLVERTENKESYFFSEEPYVVDCSFFALLPNSVFAYSISPAMKSLCLNTPKIGDHFLSKAGVVTGKDEYFLRYWHEVDFSALDLHATDITSKYVPFSKGGSFAKWYGNIVYALRLSDLWNDGKVNKSVRRGDKSSYFKECVGWSYMGGGNDKNFSILNQCVCGTGTPTILSSNSDMLNYVLGFLNTKIPKKFIELFNPTLNTYASDICNLPFIEASDKSYVISKVKDDKLVAKEDWDAYETSWDFKRNPLV